MTTTERPDDDAVRAAARALGRRGGLARMERLTPEQLSDLGRKGATARWGKRARRRDGVKR